MQLTHLLIENLRAIERLEIDLSAGNGLPRRRVVLLGANGAGKTTLLEAIAQVFHRYHVGNNYGAKEFTAGDVRNDQVASLEQVEPPRLGRIQVQATLAPEELRTSRSSQGTVPSQGPLDLIVGADLITLMLSAGVPKPPLAPGSFEHAVIQALRHARPPCVFLPADRGVLEPEDDLLLKDVADFDPRQGCLSRERSRFKPVAARLAMAFAGDMRADPQKNVARLWKVLAKYFPELPRPVGIEGLQLRFSNREGALLPLRALSDGERAILLLFGEIALRAPQNGIVLIDEVEQHLHPRWQRIIAEALSSLVPTAQFILTTQSPYLAASVPDDVVKVGDWERYGE